MDGIVGTEADPDGGLAFPSRKIAIKWQNERTDEGRGRAPISSQLPSVATMSKARCMVAVGADTAPPANGGPAAPILRRFSAEVIKRKNKKE